MQQRGVYRLSKALVVAAFGWSLVGGPVSGAARQADSAPTGGARAMNPAPSVGDAKTARLKFAAGFSLPELPGLEAISMRMPTSTPPAEGFAPNINVQIQPHAGTMAEYADLSKQEMIRMGMTIHRLDVIGDTMVIDYQGNVENRSLRWYAKAILRNARVFLITATAASEQWDDVKADLCACIDGFQLEP